MVAKPREVSSPARVVSLGVPHGDWKGDAARTSDGSCQFHQDAGAANSSTVDKALRGGGAQQIRDSLKEAKASLSEMQKRIAELAHEEAQARFDLEDEETRQSARQSEVEGGRRKRTVSHESFVSGITIISNEITCRSSIR